jgi:hypothetical protein
MRGKHVQREQGLVVRPYGPIWSGALADESGATFRDVVTPQVRLEGSIFAKPIDGRDDVWTSLRTAGGITDTLTFTHESTESVNVCAHAPGDGTTWARTAHSSLVNQRAKYEAGSTRCTGG